MCQHNRSVHYNITSFNKRRMRTMTTRQHSERSKLHRNKRDDETTSHTSPLIARLIRSDRTFTVIALTVRYRSMRRCRKMSSSLSGWQHNQGSSPDRQVMFRLLSDQTQDGKKSQQWQLRSQNSSIIKFFRIASDNNSSIIINVTLLQIISGSIQSMTMMTTATILR